MCRWVFKCFSWGDMRDTCSPSRSRGFNYNYLFCWSGWNQKISLSHKLQRQIQEDFSSPAAEVLPSVGRLLPYAANNVHPNAKGSALMSRMQPGGGVSHTHAARNALTCHPTGERFRFQVGRAGAKASGGSPLTAWCWQRSLCRPPQRVRDSNLDTHTHTAAIEPQHTDATHATQLKLWKANWT